jgi:carbon storage regulator
MLRITRRAGERIVVGDDVIIEVTEIRGGTVRLGIDAPRSLSIYREEIWLEVKRENEAAVGAASGDLSGLAVRLKENEGAEGARHPGEGESPTPPR